MTSPTPPDSTKLLQLIDGTISQDRQDPTRIVSYLYECRQVGIDVLPIDINLSELTCALEDECHIRLGFALISPEEALFVEDILRERREHGDFGSFQDFCERIDLENIPAEFITRAIQVGAFDAVEPSRARIFQGRETIIQAVRQAKVEKDTGQISLFAVISPPADNQTPFVELPHVAEWTENEVITREKDAIGFSFTEFLCHDEEQGEEESSLDIPENGAPSQLAESAMTSSHESVQPEEEYPPSAPARVIIRLSTSAVTEPVLRQLQKIIKKYPGPSRIILEFVAEGQTRTWVQTHAEYSIRVSDDFAKDVETLLGDKATRVQQES